MRVISLTCYFLGTVFILTGLAVITLFNVDFGRFKPQIQSFASEQLNSSLRITGPLHFTVSPREGIKLNVGQLTLEGAGPNSSSDIVRLKSIDVTVALSSLLLNPIQIDSVVIDGLHVKLEKDSQGRGNWEFFDNMEAPVQEEPIDEEDFRLPVWPTVISITNSSVRYNAQGDTPSYHLEIATLTEQVLPSNQVDLSLDGTFNQSPIALAIESQSLNSLVTFTDVELNVSGKLADLGLSGDLSVTDLLAPYRPTADLKVTSPAIEKLFQTFNAAPVTHGPLDLALSLAPQGQEVKLLLSGALGEFNLETTGSISDLQQFADIDLVFFADGPDAGGVADLFLPDLLPNDSFRLSGKLVRSGATIVVPEFSANIGTSTLSATGQVNDFANLSGAEASVQLDVPELADYSRLLSVPGTLEGPLRVDAQLQSLPSGGARLTSSAIYKDMVASIGGKITGREQFAGSNLLVSYQGQSIQNLLQILDMPSSSSAPVSVEANLERTMEGANINSLAVALGPDKLSATGSVSIDLLAGESELDMKLSGPALAKTLAIFSPEFDKQFEGISRPYSLNANLNIEDGSLSLAKSSFQLGETQMTLEGEFGLEPVFDQGNITLEANSEDILPIAPKVSQRNSEKAMPLELQSSIHWEQNLWTIDRLELLLGKASVTIEGAVNGPPDFGKTDLALDVKVQSLADLGALWGGTFPNLPASMTGKLAGRENTLSFSAFQSEVGTSELAGDVVYHYGDKPKIVASLTSRNLDLRPFLPPPLTTATDGSTSSENKGVATGKRTTNKNERVIPNTTLPLEILDSFDADLDLSVQRVRARAHTVENLVIRGTIISGAAHLEQLDLTTPRGGKLKALVYVEPSKSGANIGLRVRGQSLSLGLPAGSQKDVDGLPKYSLDLAANGEGGTIRELSKTLNGYTRVVAGPGKVNSGGMRLLTNDFLAQLFNAVNPYTSVEPYANIRCATVLAAMEGGRVYGDPVLVLQTDKLHIFSRTEVELKDESLDLHFKTVPQEGLGVSMANLINPYVMVTGTFAQPALSLDGGSAVVHGGAAILTAGFSILATSIADRYLSPKDPCGQSLLESSEGLLALEKKHALRAAPLGWLEVN